jgi:hypothetical protein
MLGGQSVLSICLLSYLQTSNLSDHFFLNTEDSLQLSGHLMGTLILGIRK